MSGALFFSFLSLRGVRSGKDYCEGPSIPIWYATYPFSYPPSTSRPRRLVDV